MTARIMTTYQGKLPPVIRLEPEPGTSLLGRAGGFLIHGDNTESNASQGCIIVGGAANRNIIWNDGDRIIEVVP
jgi:hypothetical protein